MTNVDDGMCLDASYLAFVIAVAIIGTLLLCAGSSLLIWHLVRNHSLSDKLLALERGFACRNKRPREEQIDQAEAEQQQNGEKGEGAPRMAAVGREPEQINELSRERQLDEHHQEEKAPIDEGKQEERMDKAGEEEEGKEEAEPVQNGEQHRRGVAGEYTVLSPQERKQVSADKGKVERKDELGAADKPSEVEKENQSVNANQLRELLSVEQFGTLEINRQRLERERRQLRELGVI